jgi:hypothetical protein
MFHRTFWTPRRFAGFTLLLGCFLFLGAAGLTPRDAQGNFSVSLPAQAKLLVIAEQTTLFQWSTSLFLSGILVTALGFALLTKLLSDSGERTFSYLGLIVSLFGVVLLVIVLAFGLGVNPLAGQETARTGVVPAYYEPLTVWTTALFRIYTVSAFSALTLYGGALLVARVLPRWISWTALLYGLAGLGLVAYYHDIAPFVQYLLPIVMGILLLRGHPVPQSSRAEVEPIVASTPGTK